MKESVSHAIYISLLAVRSGYSAGLCCFNLLFDVFSFILAILNPILDASHTQNLRISPPNSACFPGTRLGVTQNIHTWADSSLIFGDHPHILWIYGYAGCGKSAIAQEMATYFARKG